ncbi:MAG: 2,3-diphosphoglycerate-dependent phosphoglycerate mutase [Methyloceanibacter sp.]|uniref:2,3-diphosphoglycerate-dependent phosphoglycerate mutase n=1 Tax=Methyloceanibacter sp. TaxID=1965321 RepID=UPI003D6CCA78
MPRLILLRHGESVWNRDNLFTGWTDVDLAQAGVAETKRAAALLRAHDIRFDHCFTSVLKRAIHTAWIVLDEMNLAWLPVSRSWRLNERHYGALQGRNKDQMRREVGDEQVHKWRRSYRARPPALEVTDERYPGHDPRYALIPRDQLPLTESLEDTVARVIPYWQERVEPLLMAGRTALVAAHGTSLRGVVKYLDKISDDEIETLEIPTGKPLVYELDAGLRPVRSYYIDDTDEHSALPEGRRARSR